MELSLRKLTFASERSACAVDAAIVVIPVPYDDASSLIKGADLGPEAFFEAYRQMSYYDIETDTEVFSKGVLVENPFGENLSAEALIDALEPKIRSLLEQGKFITIIGGDHTLSIATMRAYKQTFENLTVLHLDAHVRLLNHDYESGYHQSGAMREANEELNLIQIGIRSMHASEKEVLKRQNVFFAHDIRKNPEWMSEAIDHMTRDVYLSFDMNVFDPAVLRNTNQPEPGGLFWDETLKFLRKVSKKRNITGFEIVGLAPQKDDRLAGIEMARLHHKLLSYIFKSRNKQK